MLDLLNITEEDVHSKIKSFLNFESINTNQSRILNTALILSNFFSFTNNRTYPRPDHPDEIKRKPIIFMLVAILVSLRTTLENEQKAVGNLLLKFPTSEDLFAADVESIEICIQPAGMAYKKARIIRRALDYVIAHFDKNLEMLGALETETAREKILQIPGVGPKSADCLLSIGLGKPSIAVDVNVFRVTSWLFNFPWSDKPNYSDNYQVQQVKKILDESLPKDAFLCQIVHTYFLLYGKKIGIQHLQNGVCLMQDYCMTCQQKQNIQMTFFN